MIIWDNYPTLFSNLEQWRKEKVSWADIALLIKKYYRFSVTTDNIKKRYEIWLGADKERIVESVKAKKQTQRYADTNRIERKSFRSYARIENALAEYHKELIKVLKEYNISEHTKLHPIHKHKAAGIVHLSDSHFNELVNLPFNQYDFLIASKRYKKFINQTKAYFKTFGVENVLFAMTGDILNSDRRLDELLSQATNRSKATVLAVHIIEQIILDLNSLFNVQVVSVTGNESRVSKEIGFGNLLATDNYDFTIFEFLKYVFKGSGGVLFERGEDATEQVINIGGQNILIIHGEQITKDTEKEVQRLIGKWADNGIKVSFVIFGHLHSCRIGDTYARSSSSVGANAYSDKALQLVSRASQNIHIIYDENSRDSIKIDLQDTKNVIGYPISMDFAAYNIKSADKLHKPTTIFQVTI